MRRRTLESLKWPLMILAALSAATVAGQAASPPKLGVLAHRGLCLVAPENTLAAFHQALDAGYGFELDVYASKDGVPVVIHDPTVDRTTNGSGKVESMTLAELKQLDAGSGFDAKFAGQRIPTLDEVLALVAGHARGDVTIALHMKRWDKPLLEKTIGLVGKHGLFKRTYAFGQPPEASRQIKQIDHRMRTVMADFSDPRKYADPDVWSRVLAEKTCDGLWVHFIPTQAAMHEARQHGKPVYLYTARNDAEFWRQGKAAGVIFCLNDVTAWMKAVATDR